GLLGRFDHEDTAAGFEDRGGQRGQDGALMKEGIRHGSSDGSRRGGYGIPGDGRKAPHSDRGSSNEDATSSPPSRRRDESRARLSASSAHPRSACASLARAT